MLVRNRIVAMMCEGLCDVSIRFHVSPYCVLFEWYKHAT